MMDIGMQETRLLVIHVSMGQCVFLRRNVIADTILGSVSPSHCTAHERTMRPFFMS